MARNLTSVKNLCEASRSPYFELCYEELNTDHVTNAIIRKTLAGIDVFDIRTPYVYCGRVEDVHLFGRSFIHTKNNTFVFHSQSYQNHNDVGFEEIAAYYIDRRREKLFTRYFEDECIFLGGANAELIDGRPSALEPGGVNFGHFIFEYLNRLVIFDLQGLLQKLPIVVYQEVPERWLGFLELMGVSRSHIVRVPIMEPPAFRKVWVSSPCHYRDSNGVFRYWGAALHWMRYRVLSAIGGPKLGARRRLYLGREDATWRKIVNEDAVKHLLAQHGFEFPQLAKMSAREQVETVSGAEIIVSAVGAGTVITQFSPEHCVNILLAPQVVGKGPWNGLGSALFLRQNFERLDCELAADSATHRANVFGTNETADFKVDMAKFQTLLEGALNLMAKKSRTPALVPHLDTTSPPKHYAEDVPRGRV